jgi:hypothetical protein
LLDTGRFRGCRATRSYVHSPVSNPRAVQVLGRAPRSALRASVFILPGHQPKTDISGPLSSPTPAANANPPKRTTLESQEVSPSPLSKRDMAARSVNHREGNMCEGLKGKKTQCNHHLQPARPSPSRFFPPPGRILPGRALPCLAFMPCWGRRLASIFHRRASLSSTGRWVPDYLEEGAKFLLVAVD